MGHVYDTPHTPLITPVIATASAKNRRVVMFVIDNPGEVKVEGAGEVK